MTNSKNCNLESQGTQIEAETGRFIQFTETDRYSEKRQ